MGITRALFASIGVSVSLVAAAAMSLFAVSVVIAFGGWSAGLGGSEPATTLIFGGADVTPAKGRGDRAEATPVVLAAVPRPRAHRAAAAPAHAVAQSGGAASARAISHAVATYPTQKALSEPPDSAPPAPVVHIPAKGDGVRRVGEDLSSTATSTGKALADLVQPLGPPVSAAVQKVLDLVAVLLQRTTDSLGGTLDKAGR